MRWYKQNCDLFEREWAKDAKMVAVYAWLHCHAYVQDGRLHGQVVRRGTCPTSRAAIMEGTGLSEQEVKSRLRRLADYGEVIIKPTNVGTFITLCDYDVCDGEMGLFGVNSTSQEPAKNQPRTSQEPAKNQPIYNKTEEYREKEITTLFLERERGDALAYEMQKLYNRTFAGVLPEWKRVTKNMSLKVQTCIRRYGRASVDMVFDQVKHEKFSLGVNRTGFIATHSYIFELKRFEEYLSRWELRKKGGGRVKGAQGEPAGRGGCVEAHEVQSQKMARRELLMMWVERERQNRTEAGQRLLRACRESGELRRLKIEWKEDGEAGGNGAGDGNGEETEGADP